MEPFYKMSFRSGKIDAAYVANTLSIGVVDDMSMCNVECEPFSIIMFIKCQCNEIFH